MVMKDNTIKEINEKQERSNQNTSQRTSQGDQRFTKKNGDSRMNQSMPFKIDMADLSQGISQAVSEKSYQSNNSQTYFTPNGCPFIVVNSMIQQGQGKVKIK